MHFGATLRLLRVDAGFSLRELADRLGVSNAYLSRVENGHDAAPTPDRLVAIARTFGLPPTMLIELADRMKPLAADYLDTVPAARELLLDVVRRKLGPIEIARIRAFIDREFPSTTADARAGHVGRLFDPARVVIGLSCADLEDVVDVAATRLAGDDGRADAVTIAGSILSRERAAPSALGSGLAIPHAAIAGVTARAVAVTLRRPLKVDTPDGLPLRLVVVHVQPTSTSHASRLADIADLARLAEPEIVEKLAASRVPEDLVSGILDALPRRAP